MLTASTMMIIGGVIAALGLGALIYGVHLNNDLVSVTASIVKNGNASPGTVWIIIGIIALLAGIGMIAYFWLKKTTPGPSPVPRPAPAPERLKVCPSCGKTYSGTAKFCPFCGGKAATPGMESTCPFCESLLTAGVAFCPACGKQVRTAAPAALAVCPSCGRRLEKGQAFCVGCGASLTPAPASEPVPVPRPEPIFRPEDNLPPPLYGPPPESRPEPKPKSGWGVPDDSDL